jgi:uncharacterized protein with beta-barrel porin domain
VGVRIQTDYSQEAFGWELVPLVSVDYTYLMQDSVEEENAGSIGLAIDYRADSIVTVRAGFEADTALRKSEYWSDWLEVIDGVWRPSFALRWRQVVVGADREIRSHFLGAPQLSAGRFMVRADDAAQGIEVGAGIDFTPKRLNRLTFGLRYDGFFWTGIQSNDISGRVRYSF